MGMMSDVSAGRLIIQSAEGRHIPYLDATNTLHRDYASACEADFRRYDGMIDPGCSAAWNRIRLILDAFDEGYRRVVWLDADVVVTKPNRNIFTETPGEPPILMKRAYMAWPGLLTVWNSGVMVVRNCPETHAILEYVWEHRHAELRPWHADSLWESNWLFDALAEQPDCVDLLDPRWNWMVLDMTEYGPEGANILGFHGMPHEERWRDFSAAVAAV